MLLAVTAEIVARFLFAEITHDPELLARLFVLYFEKGSAADPRSSTVSPSEEERKDDEDDDGEVEEDARTVGGSLRLSQVGVLCVRDLACCVRGFCSRVCYRRLFSPF